MREDWHVRLSIHLPRGYYRNHANQEEADAIGAVYVDQYPTTELRAIHKAIVYWAAQENSATHHLSSGRGIDWKPIVEVRRESPPRIDFPETGPYAWRRVKDWEDSVYELEDYER